MEERSIDKLARYILIAISVAVILALCWYFKTVILYILIAAIVALIGKPLMALWSRIRIGKFKLPSWIGAILTIGLILFIFIYTLTQIVPVITGIAQSISMNVQGTPINATPDGFTNFLENVNYTLKGMFPSLAEDFKLEDAVLSYIKQKFSFHSVSNVIGSVASILSSIGIGLFSVVFISFFFLRNRKLFQNIICALVPDEYEGTTKVAIGRIEFLLSRYFIGLIVEVLGVTLLDFLGLWLICDLSVYNSFGIAVIAGILNIVPYVGPLTGGIIGTILGMLLKVSFASAMAFPISFWTWTALFLAVFFTTQIVDNFLFQPLIYSTSIKSNPLEIFIVLLIAGHVGGILGMVVAIPSYTVIRVVASEYFYHIKAFQRLIPDKEKERKGIIMDIEPDKNTDQ